MMSGWMENRQRLWRQTFLCAALGAALCLPGAATAQEIDDGSKARVNLASKLGMLSEKIAGAACRLSANIETNSAQRTLSDSRVEVEAILNGLEFGNRTLGIPTPEKQSRLLRSLRITGSEWAQMSQAIDKLLAGTDVGTNAAFIVETARKFDEQVSLLASEVQARYSNPNEMLVVDALAIEMAGRQRMLIQKAAAEACLLAAGSGDPAVLKEAAGLFEKTLIALRDGYPAAGIRKPPNDQVLGKVEAAWLTWQDSKAVLEPALNGTAIDAATVSQITANAEKTLIDMNDLVIFYILSTPGRDGAIRQTLKEFADTELIKWTQDPALIAAVNAQNQTYTGIGQDQIDALDKQWRAEAKAEGKGPLVNDLMSRPESVKLLEKQVATAGFINEIFAMDNHGLNVAQSAVTSDFWQGDEDKWQQSYGDGTGDGAVHISEVEFDDSTGVFQSQVSLPIKDPATGKLIGAITFGVNVQSLM